MECEKQIAILMATYNGGKYIREQIDSIVNQTFNNWHLYIRDDGSYDNTISIIKEYCKVYNNITLIHDALGTLGCRDQFLYLLKIVNADYYMFCDQDDKWFYDKIEKSYKFIQYVESENPGMPILIGSDSSMCGPNLEVINKSCWDHLHIHPRKFLNINGIYVYPFITGASMILNKKVRDILPPIPEGCPKNRPMYDWWILINAYKLGIVELLEEPTRFYRQHANNVSGGLDKLDSSYLHKLGKISSIYKVNRIRANVLKKIGYGSILKYYIYKVIFLLKMVTYKVNKR